MNTVFLAGATGALGRQIAPLLMQAGYRVFGSTRSKARAQPLESVGVTPVVLDVFDAQAVAAALSSVHPDIVVHMLSDLPRDLSSAAMVEGKVRNARIWTEGTRNLVAAAKHAGTRKVIAQSLAWLYAPGPEPHQEGDPLGTTEGDLKIVLEAVTSLEHAVLETPPLHGTVLRFGLLYGPRTSSHEPQASCSLHVQAAAHAVLLAMQKGAPGVYNIADECPTVSTEKAKRELEWSSTSRLVPAK